MKTSTWRPFSALSSRTPWAALILIILIGFGLRLHNLNGPSLRGDETFTVMHWMREPIQQSLSELKTIDPQPPLAYALYRAYGLLLGSQEPVVRFLSAFGNLIGVAAAYALGKRLAGRNVGLLSALLFAVSPAIVWHAQDARHYGLWAAASVTSLWLALRALDRGRLIDWALYLASAAAACYLYYLELFVVLALNLYVFSVYWPSRRTLLAWIGVQALLAAVLALWFLQPDLLSGGGYGGTAGQASLPQLFTVFIPALLVGTSLDAPWSLAAAVVGSLLILLGLAWLWRNKRRYVWLIGLLITVSLAGITLVSTRLNVFVPRYILSLAPVLMVSAAASVGWFSTNRRALQTAIAILWAFLAAILVLATINHRSASDYAKAPDWRQAAAYLALHVEPGDTIVNLSADIALTFYLKEAGIPNEELYLPANPRQSAEEIAAVLAERSQDDSRYWYVARPPQGWPNASAPLDYADALQLIRQVNVAGMPIAEYQTAPQSSLSPSIARLGDTAELVVVEVDPVADPDGLLTVTLLWRALNSTMTPLKGFVHVLGAENPATGTPLWTQDDQWIGDSATSTASWGRGDLVRQVFRVPVSALPSGDYSLSAGLYDPESGARLIAADGSDSVSVGQYAAP